MFGLKNKLLASTLVWAISTTSMVDIAQMIDSPSPIWPRQYVWDCDEVATFGIEYIGTICNGADIEYPYGQLPGPVDIYCMRCGSPGDFGDGCRFFVNNFKYYVGCGSSATLCKTNTSEGCWITLDIT